MLRNLTKISLFSLVYLILYDLPLLNFKNSGLLNSDSFFTITLLIPTLFILFTFVVLLLPKFISTPITMVLFAVGGIATYYLVNFGKTLDNGVIIDLLSVEKELIYDYISWRLILYISISLLIPIIIEFILVKYAILFSNKIIIGFPITCLIIAVIHNIPQKLDFLGRPILDYPPFKHFYVTQQFLTKYNFYTNQTKTKHDLTTNYTLEFTPTVNDPLTVVLVIGESMRGDINSLNGYTEYNNMPFLTSRPHLVSFPKAKSSATTTRVAIPYMLTNATPPDFEKAINTKGIISIFKKLGFKTSWIGNQGLFGYYDANYASNALEADFIISNNDIRIHLNQKLIYDENLLPYVRNRLNEVKSNHLLVVHLIGSHWHFNNRYPDSFGHKFTPTCTSFSVSECTNQELLNSYHNTVVYTDHVLNLILQELDTKNAILLYASDHGFSLNEQNLFGNAYEGPNIPKEQLTIEMFSWVSDKFLQNNKKSYNEMLKHKNKDISHDYIFHSLLDCSGVKAGFVDRNLSICH